METLFDIAYLTTVIMIGIRMIRKSKGVAQYRLFGIMAVILGLGDAFHLVPRAIALFTTGLENYTFALGVGKFITSVTMTVFYVLLYYVWRLRYKVEGKQSLTITVYALAILRIILCLLHPGGAVCRYHPSNRRIDDSQNLRLCRECSDWLLRYEKAKA